MSSNGNGQQFRVSYRSHSGSSTQVGIARPLKDGGIAVFLTRDFPPTEIQRGSRKGDLQYRFLVSRVNGDEARDDSPLLEAADGERLVVRARVAGLEDPPYFGTAFVNAATEKAGPSLSVAVETLPVPTEGRTGIGRMLEIRSEAKPEPKSGNGGTTSDDDTPF